MKKIWLLSIVAFILSLTAFGCNKNGTEDIITELVKKNSTAPNNGTNNEGYGTILTEGTSSSSSSSSSTSSSSSGGTPTNIKLVFAGDTVLGGKVKESVLTNAGGNYEYPFQRVATYLKSADLAFLNLESVITDQGKASGDSALRADPAAINGLTYAGIDIVSVANDHAFDYDREGFESSLQNLAGASIAYVGGGSFEDCYTAKIIEVKGCKIAFLAFTNLGNEYSVRAQKADSSQGMSERTGIAWYYTKYVGPAIISAKKQADIVIVSLHLGKVGSKLPNLSQDHRAHYCIDQGASLVIGHHPQVIQPVMVYMKGHIAYSLGNLVSDQSDSEESKLGMLLEVLITDKKITKINRKHVQINYSYQPEINQ